MESSTTDQTFDDILTRKISAADAIEIAHLSGELGYPTSADVMRECIEFLARLEDHAIFVACLSAEVVGWIDVRETHYLQVEKRAEIGGLVVSSAARGGGIGHRLVACAERWGLQRGLKNVVVRSRIGREAAHRFYLREGYTQTKASAVFAKRLSEI
jgi:GNAT superfamily N-acetyltransferase